MKAIRYIARSAKSGMKYPDKPSQHLEEIAKRAGYKNQYWITSGQINHFPGVHVSTETQGHALTFEINGKDVPVIVYNVEQLSNNSSVIKHIDTISKN